MALLACVPGEQHELGLIASGSRCDRGWRIAYLGADTPLESSSSRLSLAPALVVLSAVTAERFRAQANELQELAKATRLYLGGAGAGAEIGADAIELNGDPVEEADRLTTLAQRT